MPWKVKELKEKWSEVKDTEGIEPKKWTDSDEADHVKLDKEIPIKEAATEKAKCQKLQKLVLECGKEALKSHVDGTEDSVVAVLSPRGVSKEI